MSYQIKVTKTEPNENYAAEVEKYEENNRYNDRNMRGIRDESYPQREATKGVLLCEVTEEQYKAIKAEVFKTFE